MTSLIQKQYRVAPLVGAWIEIGAHHEHHNKQTVAPLVGAWIEIHQNKLPFPPLPSLPSWERGLKSISAVNQVILIKSLPSWERGLKFVPLSLSVPFVLVAPLVGAWIEI